MSATYAAARKAIAARPRRWLVTGAAGFIGSHLVETLLRLGQEVVGLDNLSTGHRENLEDVIRAVGEEGAARFRFLLGDIRDPESCAEACDGVEIVLHQAALGSVPRSIEDPVASHASNVDGFVQMLVAARDAGVKRFVYASSSSVYGDEPTLPKVEGREGRLLSPYAATKKIDEIYAEVFGPTYGMEIVGLRYFNVFGPRQDPRGPYAAVIPRWILGLLRGETCRIFGDGETSRDFCYVDNAVQANLLAAVVEDREAIGRVYNVACGETTTLNQLFAVLRDAVAAHVPSAAGARPSYEDFRPGDVRHSLADIGLASRLLGYAPTHRIGDGIGATVAWFADAAQRKRFAA
ncbi:MAG TPA: SDR family oxidoreductase [Fredinandcohnia sp.]|nr:SDR family oxidoreductase [Fredinandcohnia sp.]